MEVIFSKGSYKYISACEEALKESELGRKYFEKEGSARNAIKEGLDSGNLYVALCKNICVGFFYYIPNGAFHAFPYLHLISIKKEYRGIGLGKEMMDFLENTLLAKSSVIFLVVSDFNPEAKKFYEKLGYNQVGEIPSLYRLGITEYIMMKKKQI